MGINISQKLHRIPNRQSCFITNVHDLLGQPSYDAQNNVRCSLIFGKFIIFYIKTRQLVSSYTVFYDNAIDYTNAGKTIE